MINSEHGFTMVELLVALFIFALMSVAGVALLRSSVDGQAALTARLSDHAAFMRTANLMEADLAQAMPRPVRNHDGYPVAAFSTDIIGGDGGGPTLFALTRSGLSAGDGAMTPDIGRIAYDVGGGALRRTSWPHPDGSGQPARVNLWENIRSVHVRFRAQNGQWRDDWTSNDPLAMPRAVEITVGSRDHGDIILVMPVGGLVRPETGLSTPGKV